MGEVYKFKCNDCSKIYLGRIGFGRHQAKPAKDPNKCPDCNSTNVTKLEKQGYWD
jgi:DNA-directed RNA polymerase subunit RPC12/RpoP